MKEKKKVQRACIVCGRNFMGAYQSLYCSQDCYREFRNAHRREAKTVQKVDNSAKFAALLKYTEENNLREILKKYRPLGGLK